MHEPTPESATKSDRTFPHVPLRYALCIVFSGLALLMVLWMYAATQAVLGQQIDAYASAEMRTDLAHLQGVLVPLLRAENLEGVRHVIAALGSRPEPELTLVADARGNILAATRPARLDTPWSSGVLDETLLARRRALGPLAVHLSDDGFQLSGYAELCLPGETAGIQPTPCGFIYAQRPVQTRKATASHAIRTQAFQYGLGALAVALLLWFLVHRRITRRVEQLCAAARRVTEGDWSARLHFTGHDELARIGQAFDGMLQHLTEQAQTASVRQIHPDLEAETHDRRHLEASLRDREARMQAIVETALEAIITIDERGIVDTYNAAAERLFGYTLAEVVGQNISMLMPSPYREAHDGYLTQYLRTGECKIIGLGREVVGLRKDGTVFPMALAVSEMSVGGQRMFTGMVSDITGRKHAETALREANEALEQRVQERTAALAEANEEVKRFAYIVSHDLRAPLVNLKGFAGELRLAHQVLDRVMEQALPHLSAPQTAEVQHILAQDIPEALDFIDASVTRMDSLVRAVLQLSRLGRRELRYESLDTTALVQETLQTLGHQIAQQQVQITLGSLPRVSADRIALEQIFANLLTNAVHYLEPGRPGAISLTAERQTQVTTFHLHDNGRGIAPGDIPRVFEPFRRVGRQDVPGEGMGLAYVRTLVRRHGGEITCQSTPGVGTTFTFTIAHHCSGKSQHA